MSELFGLKWRDIDFTGQQISVLRSIVKQTVGPCKTEASQKPVPSIHTWSELSAPGVAVRSSGSRPIGSSPVWLLRVGFPSGGRR
jgi:hypothetical protein